MLQALRARQLNGRRPPLRLEVGISNLMDRAGALRGGAAHWRPACSSSQRRHPGGAGVLILGVSYDSHHLWSYRSSEDGTRLVVQLQARPPCRVSAAAQSGSLLAGTG